MSSESFLPFYDQNFFPLLGKRAKSFRTMFEILERKAERNYFIVETGCLRTPGNWDGDGQSTVLFDRFVNFHEGAVVGVDLNPVACRAAASLVTAKTSLCCADSVRFLWNLPPGRKIDLLYLDSFDLDLRNPHPSSLHHVKELCAVMAHGNLQPGSIVVVDDNFPNGIGKGTYVNEFFANIGVSPVIQDYQLAWVL